MGGSMFFGAIVAALCVAAALTQPWLLIPLALVALTALFVVPLWRRGRDAAIAQKDPAPSGTASTAEASYDPTDDAR